MNIKSSLKKESLLFIIIGITAVLIDISTYMLLLSLTKYINFSKSVSFIMGASFSYFGNKNYTFNAKVNKVTPIYFALVYSSSLILNIYINKFCLNIFSQKTLTSIFISFFISTLICAIFNFVMMKIFVFKKY